MDLQPNFIYPSLSLAIPKKKKKVYTYIKENKTKKKVSIFHKQKTVPGCVPLKKN